jgi:hypothetical protein
VGTGLAIAAAGLVMTMIALALLTNYRGFGNKVAMFGGSLTFIFGGGNALRRPRRASVVWGLILLIIGLGWSIGGVILATK